MSTALSWRPSQIITSVINAGGYTRDGLIEIEDTLTWSEENFRSPQINCLDGWGIPTEPPDSPTNRRWMRVFTTMSLTHSDGYVLYATGTSGVIRLRRPESITQG